LATCSFFGQHQGFKDDQKRPCTAWCLIFQDNASGEALAIKIGIFKEEILGFTRTIISLESAPGCSEFAGKRPAAGGAFPHVRSSLNNVMAIPAIAVSVFSYPTHNDS
jgi:hypothetical protein